MTVSNRERVGRVLDLLRDGLYPFVEREMRSIYGDKWVVAATPFVPEDHSLRRNVQQILKQDESALLKLMSNQWREVFKKTLGNAERSLVGELIDTRNSWAHNKPLSTDDAYRALDSVSRLLSAFSAPEADEVDKQKQELLRVRFTEQARRETRRATLQPLEGNPVGGLKPWRDVNHLDLKKLWEYLAYYLYLPRIKNQQVLLEAIAEGVAALLWNENFAYATGWDESKGRYLGLKAAEHITVTLSSQNLIVKPEIAQRQFEADAAAKAVTPPVVKEKTGSYKTEKEKTIDTVVTENGSSDSQVTVIVPPKRFYGSVKLDALRLRRDVAQIADEVIQHLSSLVGAEVEITLELQVTVPEGVPDNVIRTVSENCRVLKFSNQEFEQE